MPNQRNRNGILTGAGSDLKAWVAGLVIIGAIFWPLLYLHGTARVITSAIWIPIAIGVPVAMFITSVVHHRRKRATRPSGPRP
jgi:Cu/Ag efflux pump CusA